MGCVFQIVLLYSWNGSTGNINNISNELSSAHICNEMPSAHISNELSSAHICNEMPSAHISNELSSAHISNELPIFNQVFQPKTLVIKMMNVGVNKWFPEHNPTTV